MGVSKKGTALYLGSGRVNPKLGNFSVSNARKILRTTIRLHQLGIFHVDIRREQFLDNKFCDLSTAITVPHFLTNPELNPKLNAKEIALMEHETFQLVMCDYWAFEIMLSDDICEEPVQKSKLTEMVPVFPRRAHYQMEFADRPYDLRRTAQREQHRHHVYALADPRKFDWKAFAAVKPAMVAKQRRKVKLPTRPERWYLNCTPEEAAFFNKVHLTHIILDWHATKEGLVYPAHRLRQGPVSKIKELEERDKNTQAKTESGETCI